MQSRRHIKTIPELAFGRLLGVSLNTELDMDLSEFGRVVEVSIDFEPGV